MIDARWMRGIGGLVVFGVASLALADDAGDGVYRQRRSGEGSTPAPIELGDHLTGQLGPAMLRADDDDNTRFTLVFLEAGPLPQPLPQLLAVRVGDVVAAVSSRGTPTADGMAWLAATIEGRATADRVATHLGITPILREHPGHRIRVTFTPTRAVFPAGTDVTATLMIENVGSTPFTFFDGGQQRGPRNNQFRFLAWRDGMTGFALPDVGDRTNFGGIGRPITLASGETFRLEARLTDWFAFYRPGRYDVTGLYEMEFHRPDVPLHAPIWHDWAVATFMATIGPPGGSTPASDTPAEGAAPSSTP